MNLNLLNRKVHYWASFVIALPLLVVFVTGLLLQIKKQWSWVQPIEHRTSNKVPQVDFDTVLASVSREDGSKISDWSQVERIDVRPGKGIAKVILKDNWELQIDLANGAVLHAAYRRSDVIESLHDGTFFAGDWTRYGLFLPSGIVLLWLWISGMWMWWVPIGAKRRRKQRAAEAA